MTALGIRIDFVKQKFPDLLKQARAGQLQMWGLANTAGSPPGFGVMGLLYGPNAGLSNLARFNLPEFNQLYEKGKRLPDGPERNRVIRQMSELVSVYAPWKLQAYRIENVLCSRGSGYKKSFNPSPGVLDIDPPGGGSDGGAFRINLRAQRCGRPIAAPGAARRMDRIARRAGPMSRAHSHPSVRIRAGRTCLEPPPLVAATGNDCRPSDSPRRLR